VATSITKMVIGTIVEMGVEGIWEAAKRREAILNMFKKLVFKLDEPPADFDGLYAYTLVEYGVGKPEQILDLFRYDVIKDAFRRSFEQRDHAAFVSEIEAFKDSEIGREVYRLDYNPQQELAKFQFVFDKLADRARTTPEVKQDHKLDDIHYAVQRVLELSASESDASKVTHARLPQLTLKIFRHNDDHRDRDEITFRQPHDSSPFRFGLALVNMTESTVAKEIDITINIIWQDGVVPQCEPIFETPNDKGWEYYHDRIQHCYEAVLRFRGSERDRCPFGQPLKWNFSMILEERLIGEFLLNYRASSTSQEKETSGKLKIRMG